MGTADRKRYSRDIQGIAVKEYGKAEQFLHKGLLQCRTEQRRLVNIKT